MLTDQATHLPNYHKITKERIFAQNFFFVLLQIGNNLSVHNVLALKVLSPKTITTVPNLLAQKQLPYKIYRSQKEPII
jgi:hypothetical protein